MLALLLILVLLVLFGAGGFAVNWLWALFAIVLIIAVLGFFVGGAPGAGPSPWYRRGYWGRY